jgi:hypothetical protein
MAEPLLVTRAAARKVTAIATAATVFEWYDFYLYAVLAPVFAKLFFPAQNETAALMAAFAAYTAGFVVRPLGALALGRLGDVAGRKYTFLISVVVMGFSTFTIGLLPTFDQLGWLAPLLLVMLRLIQGFALGGQYGGAAIFVAEYTEASRRGSATGWIQTAATLGFLLALAVTGACRFYLPAGEFEAWGWRAPFLGATFFLIVTVWLAASLRETPVFLTIKAEGRCSPYPLWETFFRWPNNKYVFLSLFGAAAGQGVVWYTGQFYALFFLTQTLHLDYLTAYVLIGAALLAGTPFFIWFGWLSDKVGRLKIILAGCLLGAVSFVPLFHVLSLSVNPELTGFQISNPVLLRVDQRTCNIHIFSGPWSRYSACDRVTEYLTSLGLPFTKADVPGQDAVELTIGAQTVGIAGSNKAEIERTLQNTLFGVGYPGLAWKYVDGDPQVDAKGAPVLEQKKADPAQVNYPVAFLALFVLMFYVAMVYGPMAAFLVDLFPPQVRYSALSFPYHIGNGVFGGVLPLAGAALVATTGNIYAGLWYPMAVAGFTFIFGLLFLRKRPQHMA